VRARDRYIIIRVGIPGEVYFILSRSSRAVSARRTTTAADTERTFHSGRVEHHFFERKTTPRSVKIL